MKKLVVLVAGFALCGPFRASGRNTKYEREYVFDESADTSESRVPERGQHFPGLKDAESTGFINNRARLSLGYERDRLSIGLSAQHVGVWGQDPQIDKNGRFILNEAWAKLDFRIGFLR